MSKINKAIKNIVENYIKEVHTALPAKIRSFDAETMRAEVILLNQKRLGDEMVEIPPIVEVPVASYKANNFHIRPPYQKGDVVLVVFAEKALDKLLITGEVENPVIKRFHSYDDAVVIGGLLKEQAGDFDNRFVDDFVITKHNDGQFESWLKIDSETGEIEIEIDDKIWLRIKEDEAELKLKNDAYVKIENGTATIEANEVKLGEGASEGVSLGDSLKEWIDGHTHTGVSTGSGTSGPPASASPDTSDKVVTE